MASPAASCADEPTVLPLVPADPGRPGLGAESDSLPWSCLGFPPLGLIRSSLTGGWTGSLSYAWHACGHRGQLWSDLVLVALVLCFVCLLLFLNNA